MSLEQGRKWGLTGSLIAVIVPVISLTLYILAFLSLFRLVPNLFNGNLFFGSPFLPGSSIVFGVVAIVGLTGSILFLAAMHNLSKYYSEPGIFRDALKGFLLPIIGVIVLIAVLVAELVIASQASLHAGALSALVIFGSVFVVLIATVVLVIVSATFYKRAFEKLGEKSGVHNFNNAGSLYLIGTVLSLVVVGVLIVWVAWIYAALGFRSLKPKTAEPLTASSPVFQPPTASSAGAKFCPYCGAPNATDAAYCQFCGKPLPQ